MPSSPQREGERTQLTFFNEEFLKNVTLSEPEAISYSVEDDFDVHGWLMKPVNYEEGKKYPLILAFTMPRSTAAILL